MKTRMPCGGPDPQNIPADFPDEKRAYSAERELALCLLEALSAAGERVTFAESCTGGLLSAVFCSVPGASEVYDGGLVSYANSVKHRLLSVEESVLSTFGPVSEQCCAQMAKGACALFSAQLGLAVTGFVHPDKVLTNSGAKPGDALFLTKPLGIGILTTAEKADLLSENGKAFAVRLMTTLNKAARDVMVQYRVHACTDVTGFSFLGHASEMATGSDVQLEINTAAIDLIPEALDFARMGTLPAGMYRNRTFAEPMVDAGDTELAVQDVLYDPQTAGGLLIACDPADADALFAALKPAVPSAQRVGTVQPYTGGARIYLK